MAKFFCETCKKEQSYNIKIVNIEKYKNEIVNVEEKIAVCSECETEIFVPDIENENLKRLYSKYREVTGMISPEEIIKLREKYNISQRELVAILGWGKMTINRYENGSLPTKSYSDLLKDIIKNEERFKSIVLEAYENNRITKKTYEKTSGSFNSSKRNIVESLLEIQLKHEADILNGFRKFDIERVENLISYIASKVDNLYKTSLNKYLWFIDFQNFKENVRSITGLRYVKQQYGPVIEEKGYEQILDLLDDKFYKNEIEDNNSLSIKTKIISKNNFDISLFSESELEIIDQVIEKFKYMSCGKISDESHKENGWIQNNINEFISYDYADELKMSFD